MAPRDLYIFCYSCGGEYSATAGDYFLAPDEQEFHCCEDTCSLVLRGNRWQGDEIEREAVTVGDLRGFTRVH